MYIGAKPMDPWTGLPTTTTTTLDHHLLWAAVRELADLLPAGTTSTTTRDDGGGCSSSRTMNTTSTSSSFPLKSRGSLASLVTASTPDEWGSNIKQRCPTLRTLQSVTRAHPLDPIGLQRFLSTISDPKNRASTVYVLLLCSLLRLSVPACRYLQQVLLATLRRCPSRDLWPVTATLVAFLWRSDAADPASTLRASVLARDHPSLVLDPKSRSLPPSGEQRGPDMTLTQHQVSLDVLETFAARSWAFQIWAERSGLLVSANVSGVDIPAITKPVPPTSVLEQVDALLVTVTEQLGQTEGGDEQRWSLSAAQCALATYWKAIQASGLGRSGDDRSTGAPRTADGGGGGGGGMSDGGIWIQDLFGKLLRTRLPRPPEVMLALANSQKGKKKKVEGADGRKKGRAKKKKEPRRRPKVGTNPFLSGWSRRQHEAATKVRSSLNVIGFQNTWGDQGRSKRGAGGSSNGDGDGDVGGTACLENILQDLEPDELHDVAGSGRAGRRSGDNSGSYTDTDDSSCGEDTSSEEDDGFMIIGA